MRYLSELLRDADTARSESRPTETRSVVEQAPAMALEDS